jgi:heme oxygenase
MNLISRWIFDEGKTMTDTRSSIMSRLKTETRDLHSHAEGRVLQQRIASGNVDRKTFAAYLGQLYHVHRALESALESSREAHPSVAALATDDRMRVPDLHRDLEFYDVHPHAIEAGVAATRFQSQIDTIMNSNPTALLGALYVLEGSTNGGRFLAKSLRKSWGLAGDGLSYFDPYGDEQPQRWAAFRRDMDEASFEATDEEAIVEMAKKTFLAIAEVSDEVSQGA